MILLNAALKTIRLSINDIIMLIIFTCLFVPLNSVYAQKVEPMIFELEPLGSKSTESIRIENPSRNPITMEITAMSLELDELGNETNIPRDDDFLIYPPQVIIKGGATQVVKVKYVGDPLIQTSKAYRIAITQLPVDLREGGSGMNLMTKFLTVANVSPAESKPFLSVTAIEANEENKWILTVENTGNRFGTLSSTSWEVESSVDSSKKKNLSIDEVSSLISRSLVLPKSKLRVMVPAFDGYEPSTTQIKIKIPSKRS